MSNRLLKTRYQSFGPDPGAKALAGLVVLLVTICTFTSGPAQAAQSQVLFQDSFTTPGTRLNVNAWTTEIGPSSFLGRTQLADWISPGGNGQFVVGTNGAQLTLNTFNPTGFSLYGTHGKTLATFLPEANGAIDVTTRLQLTSVQPGVVDAVYLYACLQAGCATHDEIDIELVTNFLQPGSPYRVQLNRYANEPLGAGNGQVVNLPAGFDPLAAHNWTIRWSLNRIDYLVDGVLLASATDHVPQHPMQFNVIAWAPAAEWPDAYSPSLQPVSSASQNQSFIARLTAVTISETNPAFFAGQINLGIGVYYLSFPTGPVFGYFGYLGRDWIYHMDLGYEYLIASNDASSGLFLWDLTGHWFYTSPSTFPYLFDFTLNSWLYYFPDPANPGRYTANPRYFANMTTGQIFTM